MLNRANRTITSLMPADLLFEGLTIREDPDNEARISKLRKRKEFQLLGYKSSLAYILHSLFDESILPNEIVAAKDWKSLMPLLVRAEDLAAQKIQDRAGKSIAFGKFFRRISKSNKDLFGGIILTSPTPTLTLHDRISEILLWYPFEIVNSSSMIFSGASAFRSLLLGEIAERHALGVKDRVEVIRFAHPDDISWFSYAILIERYGAISNLSGWLVFLEVGGDYNGMGGFEYKKAEEILAKRAKHVEIRNFEVGVQDFRTFLESKTRTELEELRSKVISMEKLRTMMVGRLMEFVAKIFYELQGYQTLLNFKNSAVLPKKYEIDIVATNEQKKEVILIECSTNIPANIETLVDAMNVKLDAIRNHLSFTKYSNYRRVFVTTRRSINSMRSRDQILAKLLKAEIDVMEIDEIVSRRLPRNLRREELLKAFQGEMNSEEDLYL